MESTEGSATPGEDTNPVTLPSPQEQKPANPQDDVAALQTQLENTSQSGAAPTQTEGTPQAAPTHTEGTPQRNTGRQIHLFQRVISKPLVGLRWCCSVGLHHSHLACTPQKRHLSELLFNSLSHLLDATYSHP